MNGVVEDWKLQASVKFGPQQQHMLNVRAATLDELFAMLDGLSSSAHFLNSTIDAIPNPQTEVQAQTTVQSQFPATQPIQPGVVQPPAAPAPGVPTCRHGAMKFMSGISKKNNQPYQAYFCTGPQNNPADPQCAAKFVGN